MSFRRDPDHLDSLSANASDVELARALEALAQDRPTQEELQRVRRRLEATLNQQATARAHTTMLQPVAGLIVLAAAFLSVLPSLSHVPQSDSPPADKPVVHDKVEPAPLSPPSAATNESESAAAPSATLVVSPKRAQAPRIEQRPAKPRVERTQASSTVHPEVLASPAPQRASGEPRARSAIQIREPTTEAEKPAHVQLDEVALIQQARQLARDDPRAALRVLDQHKRNFPHGMLRQEREVLTIELLRALSRNAEADKQLESFRRDFPRSIYLQRLGAAGQRD